ncbi:metalloregulator ArsR/SmtB family transcription factor [Thiolapillus sp.]
MEASTLFKAMSDTTRLRCILLLASHGELCVCDLTRVLGLPQPRVSHHLGNLRQAGLVQDRRQGPWIFYRLHPDLPGWALAVIEATRKGNQDQAPFDRDLVQTRETGRA